MANFKEDNPTYRKPAKLPNDSNWHYIGDGKLHDPIIGDPAMHGNRWTIDYGYDNSKSFDKFNQGVKNNKTSE